ncbi:PTS sugar transporter subunit IIA [Lacrimispora sp.]|uniref:PTS sugar transporter subunit IIA n=1 Tax=Lacrimispora sp. TaxID=2719234 RepID=UPI002FDA7E81
MRGDIVYKELIQLDIEAENTDQVFEYMAGKLEEMGFVRPTFLEAIKKREKDYPTALGIEPYAVAIPHTDPDCIIRPFIAPIRLKKPVKWREMTGTDVMYDVKFVFMLGFHKTEGQEGADAHIELLQILVQNFQNAELMDKLDAAKSVDEYRKLILSMDGLEE